MSDAVTESIVFDPDAEEDGMAMETFGVGIRLFGTNSGAVACRTEVRAGTPNFCAWRTCFELCWYPFGTSSISTRGGDLGRARGASSETG